MRGTNKERILLLFACMYAVSREKRKQEGGLTSAQRLFLSRLFVE